MEHFKSSGWVLLVCWQCCEMTETSCEKNQNIIFHIFRRLYVASGDVLGLIFVADEDLQSHIDRLDLDSRMRSGK